MKTSSLISFHCPNCNQHFESESHGKGRDFQCTECFFNFKIPHDSEVKSQRAIVSDADREERQQPKETHDERQTRELFESASSTNGTADFLIAIAIMTLIIAIVIACNDGTPAATGIAIAISGGSLGLGLACKIIAHLIYIRAEIKAKK
jgi:DNA-directed RNA polymerase subunit RPC12/RpoP